MLLTLMFTPFFTWVLWLMINIFGGIMFFSSLVLALGGGIVNSAAVFFSMFVVCFLVMVSCLWVGSDCTKLLDAKKDSPSSLGSLYRGTLYCFLFQGLLLVLTVFGGVLCVGGSIFLCVCPYSYLMAYFLVFVWLVVGLEFVGIVLLCWYCLVEELSGELGGGTLS